MLDASLPVGVRLIFRVPEKHLTREHLLPDL